MDKRWTPYIGQFLTRYNELDLYFWEGDENFGAATVAVNKKGRMTWLECGENSHISNKDDPFYNLMKPHVEALRLAIQKGLCE